MRLVGIHNPPLPTAMKTQYYTASSLDGYIADPQHSLAILHAQTAWKTPYRWTTALRP